MLKGLLTFIFAPALVSLGVSLWVNRRSEARRARRDHITKLFEQTRDDVRRSIEAALDYFATPPAERKALQEAKVLFADRELRSAMPIILDAHPELHNENRDQARQRFETLLAELTGGSFQETDGEVDREHIRRLAHAGAGLRSALARMRDAELKILVESDPLLTAWTHVGDYLDRKFGLRTAAEEKRRLATRLPNAKDS